MSDRDLILGILKSKGPMTRSQLLAHLPQGWTTGGDPAGILDSALARLKKDPRTPLLRTRSPLGVLYQYDDQKAIKLERSLAPKPPLKIEPMIIGIDEKISEEGRVGIDNFAKVLVALSRSVVNFGKMLRGPGGQKDSDYTLEIVAPLQPGSMLTPAVPRTLAALGALLYLIDALQTQYALQPEVLKALKPITDLGNVCIGIGRPVRYVRIDWPARGLLATIDDDWFLAKAIDLPMPRMDWVGSVMASSRIAIGSISAINRAEKTFNLSVGHENQQFEYDQEIFKDVDRWRWKQVAAFYEELTHRTFALTMIPRFSIVRAGYDIFAGVRPKMQSRLDYLDRTAWMTELSRIVSIFMWTWLLHGRSLHPPSITQEEQGIGLWWRDPVTRRELDLDFQESQWRALKTLDLERVARASSLEELEKLVVPMTVNSDHDFVHLAEWLAGREEWRELVLFE